MYPSGVVLAHSLRRTRNVRWSKPPTAAAAWDLDTWQPADLRSDISDDGKQPVKQIASKLATGALLVWQAGGPAFGAPVRDPTARPSIFETQQVACEANSEFAAAEKIIRDFNLCTQAEGVDVTVCAGEWRLHSGVARRSAPCTPCSQLC